VNPKIIQALRWLAVLPGAVAAFAVAQLAVILGSLFVTLPDFLIQLWSAWVCPVAFLYAGIHIAPKYKFVVALILTTLLTGMMFVIVFLVLAGSYTPRDVNKWWFLFTCLAGIVAPIWMCASLHHEDEDGVLSE
jgi:hypothetical protein